MKGIILCALFATVCLFSEAHGDCRVGSKTLAVGEKYIDNCIRYSCEENGHIAALGCPDYRCKVQIGYRERDVSKPYPDCCEGPICAEGN